MCDFNEINTFEKLNSFYSITFPTGTENQDRTLQVWKHLQLFYAWSTDFSRFREVL